MRSSIIERIRGQAVVGVAALFPHWLNAPPIYREGDEVAALAALADERTAGPFLGRSLLGLKIILVAKGDKRIAAASLCAAEPMFREVLSEAWFPPTHSG